MEPKKKKLPVGIEMFRDIREHDFYYVDKTGFIRELLNSWGKVNLFTRPRRFGKSLNMDMLKSFFEIGTDPGLFDGLEISGEKELCQEYLGKFPVISISLKDVEGRNLEEARDMLGSVLNEEALRFPYLMESMKLNSYEKARLEPLFSGEYQKNSQLTGGLKILADSLCKHFGREVIILIDEYDVPLDKAYTNHYYEEMVQLIRSMFSQALKTNSSLRFAVITGCLRISKESIFTGINNFTVHSISDNDYDEYFGFTDAEVRKMLKYYEMDDLYETVRQWYDGYRFGKEEIYCPWDVLNYVREHLSDRTVPPKLYWINTSGNEIVRKLIKRSDAVMKQEIEQLIEGKSITKEIHTELTYKDLDESEQNEPDTRKENLWSILYTTGYLTMKEPSADARHYKLVIPNTEIREIFISQIQKWMSETIIHGDTERLLKFCEAVGNGNAQTVEKMFNEYLADTISIRDTSTAENKKENFYHGLLLGLLRGQGKWIIRSNIESGIGYADIIIEMPTQKTGCVIEVKYAENGNFDKACENAMNQIKVRQYGEILRQDGVQTIHTYGVACYKKSSKVAYERE